MNSLQTLLCNALPNLALQGLEERAGNGKEKWVWFKNLGLSAFLETINFRTVSEADQVFGSEEPLGFLSYFSIYWHVGGQTLQKVNKIDF